MEPGQTFVCAHARTLAASGISTTYVTSVTNVTSDLTAWAACAGNAIEGYEGPNEYDINHSASDTAWPSTLATFQRYLYRSVKGTPAIANLRVIGPSLTSGSAYAAVGNLSAYEDAGNMHDYFDGRNPGTPGWGANGYGSIAYNLGIAAAASPGSSIESTETGYGITAAGDDGYVTDWVAGKYMPRLFLEHWNAGVPRTYAYELYDEGVPGFNDYGLVDSTTLAPRWGYVALKNLITVLQDGAMTLPGAGPLYWSMSGQTWNVHHAVLQKGDGSCFLALWVEWPSNDPNSGASYSIPPQQVTISMPAAPKTASLYTYDSQMNLNPATLASSKQYHLSVTDTVQLLRMKW
jgi:hypothetical protein